MSGIEIGICFAAILVGVLVKAVTGMGLPLIAIPTIALFVSLEDAVVVLALPTVSMNLALCLGARSHARQTRDLPALGTAGLVGGVLGTVLLVRLPEKPLLLVLALTVFGYVVHRLRNPEASLAPEVGRRWSPAVGLAGGVMQGALGISAPLFGTWLHAYRLPPHAFVFSVTLLFSLCGVAQLAALAAHGAIHGARLWISLAAVPLVLGPIPLGTRLRDRLGGQHFDRAVLAVLLVSGVSLMIRVLR